MRKWCAVIPMFLASALAGPAAADAECSTDNFRARVTEALGYDPIERDQTLAIEVAVQPGELLSGSVVIRRNGEIEGSRTLSAAPSECDELLRALAHTAATAIDPTTVMMREASAASPDPDAQRNREDNIEARHERVEVGPATTSPSPAIPIRFEADARGGFLIDALPANAGTLEVDLGVRIGSFSILAEGMLAFGGFSETRNGHRSRADAVAGGLALCLRETIVGVLQGVGCVAGVGGVLFGHSDTVTRPLTHTSTYAALDARLGLGFRVGDVFSIEPLFRLQVPLVRTTFLIDGNPAWTANVFAFGAALNLSAVF